MHGTTLPSPGTNDKPRPDKAPNLMSRVWLGYARWQAEQSDAYVKDIQSTLPDKALKDLGYTDDEIADIRRRRAHAASHWG